MFGADKFVSMAMRGGSKEAMQKGVAEGSAYGLLGYMSSAFTSNASQLRRNMNIMVSGANKYFKELGKSLEKSMKSDTSMNKLVTTANRQTEKLYRQQQQAEDRRHQQNLKMAQRSEDLKKKEQRMVEKVVQGNTSGGLDLKSGLLGGFLGYMIGAQKEIEKEEELFDSLSTKVMSLLGMTRKESRKFWVESAQDIKELNKEFKKNYFAVADHQAIMGEILKTSVTNKQIMTDMARTALIASKIAPEIDLASYKMFTQIIDLYKDGGETMMGIVETSKTLSQNFWVDNDKMMKAADSFSRHVRHVARSGREYQNTMKDIMHVVVALEDNFFDSSKAIEKSLELINTPIHKWGEETYKYLAAIGISDFAGLKNLLWNAPGQGAQQLLEMELSSTRQAGLRQGWLGADNRITNFEAFGNYFDVMGLSQGQFGTPTELANALKDPNAILNSLKASQETEIKSYTELVEQNTWLGKLDSVLKGMHNWISSNEGIQGMKMALEENLDLSLQNMIIMATFIKMIGLTDIFKEQGGIFGPGGIFTKSGRLWKGGATIGKTIGEKSRGIFGTTSRDMVRSGGQWIPRATAMSGTYGTAGFSKIGTGIAGGLGKIGLGKVGTGIAASMATNPVGWFIGALIALGLIIFTVIKNWDKIKEKLQASGKVLDRFKDAWAKLKEAGAGLWNSLKELWKVISPGATTGLWWAVQAAVEILILFVGALTSVANGLKTFADFIVDVIEFIRNPFKSDYKGNTPDTNPNFSRRTGQRNLENTIVVVDASGVARTERQKQESRAMRATRLGGFYSPNIKPRGGIGGAGARGPEPGTSWNFGNSGFDRVSSGYGMRSYPSIRNGEVHMHHGVDLVPKYANAPIISPVSGEVVFSGWGGNARGLAVVVKDEKGLHHVFQHNSANLVSEGMPVNVGDALAKVGSSGYSTGAHLHYEVTQGLFSGGSYDPTPWMPSLLNTGGAIDYSQLTLGAPTMLSSASVASTTGAGTGVYSMPTSVRTASYAQQAKVWNKAMSRTPGGATGKHMGGWSSPSYSGGKGGFFPYTTSETDVSEILAKMEWMVAVLAGKLTELKADAETRARIANIKQPSFIDVS